MQGSMLTCGGPTGFQLLLLQCVLLFQLWRELEDEMCVDREATVSSAGTLPVLSCAQACDLK